MEKCEEEDHDDDSSMMIMMNLVMDKHNKIVRDTPISQVSFFAKDSHLSVYIKHYQYYYSFTHL